MNHAGRMRRLQAAMKAQQPVRVRYNTVDGRRITRQVNVVEMRGDTVWLQDITQAEEPKSFKKAGVTTAQRVKPRKKST